MRTRSSGARARGKVGKPADGTAPAAGGKSKAAGSKGKAAGNDDDDGDGSDPPCYTVSGTRRTVSKDKISAQQRREARTTAAAEKEEDEALKKHQAMIGKGKRATKDGEGTPGTANAESGANAVPPSVEGWNASMQVREA